MRVPFPAQAEWLESRLQRLIEANQSSPGQPLNATLRVVWFAIAAALFEGPAIARDFDVDRFHRRRGDVAGAVKLGVVPDGRHAASEFAGTKYISWAENLTRYERAHEQGLDEVILLNERGEVSECTSANVFMVDAATAAYGPRRSPRAAWAASRARCCWKRSAILKSPSARKRCFRTTSAPRARYSSLRLRANCSRSSASKAWRFKAGRAVCDRLREAFSARVNQYVKLRPNPVYN